MPELPVGHLQSPITTVVGALKIHQGTGTIHGQGRFVVPLQILGPITGAVLADYAGAVLVGDTLSWTLPSLSSGEVWTVSFAMTATGTSGFVIVNDEYAVVATEWPAPVIGIAAETQVTAGCDAADTPIYTIQGNGDSSPLDNQPVQACGVVVGVAPGLKGFFIQALVGDGDAATSDGIFVYRDRQPFDMALGDVVEISGSADEYYDVTRISARYGSDTLTVLANGYPLPEAVTLDPPADRAAADAALEAVEGMLVLQVAGPVAQLRDDALREGLGAHVHAPLSAQHGACDLIVNGLCVDKQ